jgi:hypothetical protein
MASEGARSECAPRHCLVLGVKVQSTQTGQLHARMASAVPWGRALGGPVFGLISS